MIIWRGLSVNIDIPFADILLNTIKEIGHILHLPSVFPLIFYPFIYILGKLSMLELNLNSVNVTCEGSQAGVELLVNCLILGEFGVYVFM